MYITDSQQPLSASANTHCPRCYRFFLPLTMLMLVALLFLPAVAKAQGTIEVTTPIDALAADTACSLREAIESANTDTDIDSCTRTGTAPYTINVPADTYLLTLPGTGEDNNATGDLDIRTSLVISGAGVDNTFIQGGATTLLAIDRVLQITGTVDVTITGVTVRYGNATGVDENGGGIAITGGATVQINDSALTDNSSQGDQPGEGGGALFNDVNSTLTLSNTDVLTNTAINGLGNGGGILNAGSLTIMGGEIANNQATRAGGGVENNNGTTAFIDTQLNNNLAGINGGGLHISAAGIVTMTGGSAAGNVAQMEGGALWNSAGGALTVQNAMLTANNANGNAADQGGGAIHNDGGTLVLTDTMILTNTALGTSGSGGGILAVPGSAVTISGGEINGNSASRAGGGIEIRATMTDVVTATVTSVMLAGNDTGSNPGNGGALHITGPADVTVNSSTVMSNTAAAEGGGLWNSAVGTLTVANSTIQGNSASGNAADQGGGGLYSDGGPLIVTNSTINNNQATGTAGSGGGILVNPGGRLDFNGGTISGNRANRAGGGIELNATVTDTAAITVSNVSLVNNSTGSTPGNGGGLHITGPGSANFLGGTVSNNMAVAEGGGLWNSIAGTLTVSDTLITFNMASGVAADQGGGGIYNDGGALTVTNAEITNNQADGTAGSGGGILIKGGTASVTGGMINGNMAMRAGGGIEINAGTVTDTITTTLAIDSVTLESNSTGSSPGNGGALHITGPGSVTVTDSTVANNTAAAEGGGLWNSAAGTLSLMGTRLESNVANGNDADQGGGGLFNDGGSLIVTNTTILNNRADGTSGSGGGILNNGGTLQLSASTLTGNTAMRAGGAVEDNAGSGVTISGSTFNSNSTGANPGNGGALHITGAGTVTVTMSSVMSNTASAEGGGLWNSVAGTLFVDKSTLSQNMASGSASDQGGGALYNDGGTLQVSNSTISANNAVASGGGLHNNNGSAALTNVTFYENGANNGAGGISNSGANLAITNTIVAHMAASGDDCSGVTAGAFNLDSDGTCQAAITADPMLDTLKDNGGATLTHALLVGSLAIDAGDNATCAAAPINNVDQRGMSRPVGTSCDLGAYEGSTTNILMIIRYLPLLYFNAGP